MSVVLVISSFSPGTIAVSEESGVPDNAVMFNGQPVMFNSQYVIYTLL